MQRCFWVFPGAIFALTFTVLAGCGNAADAEGVMAAKQASSPMSVNGALASDGVPARPTSEVGESSEVALRARAIIQTATLGIRVPKIGEAADELRRQIRAVGGFVESSQGNDLSGTAPAYTLQARIPANRFEGFLANATRVGDVTSQNLASEDVTDQIVDAEARLKSLRAEEIAYREMLAQTRRVSDTLEVRSRLGEVRTEIERLDAARLNLQRSAAMSTVTFNLSQTPVITTAGTDRGWFVSTLSDAVGTLGASLRGIAGNLIYVAVMAPVWLLPVLAVAYAVRRGRRTTSQ